MAPRSIKSWDDLDLVVGSLRVAQLLGYTVDRVQRLAKEGKIPAFRLGGSWRFEKSALQEWIKSKRNTYQERSQKNGNIRQSTC